MPLAPTARFQVSHGWVLVPILSATSDWVNPARCLAPKSSSKKEGEFRGLCVGLRLDGGIFQHRFYKLLYESASACTSLLFSRSRLLTVQAISIKASHHETP
jgi:hypothetical protein